MFKQVKDFRDGVIERAALLPLPQILNLLNIIMAMAVLLASLVVIRGFILAKLDTGNNLSQNILPVSQDKDDDLLAYALIGKNNPFGGASKESRSLYKPSLDSPQLTRDDLVLVGTIVGSLNQFSYAIFKTKGPAQEVVALKSEIPGVGVLDEVSRNQVFIKKGGSRFSMPIQDDKPAGFSNGGPSPSGNVQEGSSSRTVNRDNIISAIENPVSILTDARISPVSDGKGFVLSEVKTGGFYDTLGLSNGDILIDINGHEISNPEEALKMVTAIKGMDNVQINIIRGNKPESLEYFIK